jgi:uncharacterized protein (UPF0332 family)
MFHAARAALIALDAQAADIKTHATVIRRFGQLVRSDATIDRRLGRALNRGEHTRWRADYTLQMLLACDVSELLADMDDVVDAVAKFLDRATTP